MRRKASIFLSHDGIRRVLLSLIGEEQRRLIEKGNGEKEQAVELKCLGRSNAEIDRLSIDEDSLGFDSLSRLDLVLVVNRFFQLHTSGIEDYLLVRRGLGNWVALISQHLELRADHAQIAFQTSGSMGAPKTAIHDMPALTSEIEAILNEPHFEGTSERSQIISLVPPHHIYGFLFSCLLPSMMSAKTIALHQQSPLRSFALARSGDIVIATPYLWDKLAQSGVRFAPGVIGVTSGAPSSPTTWSIRETAGLSELVEVYGATETGGIGMRTAADQPFKLLGHLEREGERVRRKNLAHPLLDIQDRMDWVDAHHFELAGRHDRAVQVAGVNVSLGHVADVIGSVDGVRSAEVRFDGHRLRAFAVPEDIECETAPLENRIRRHLIQHLAAPARPVDFTFGLAPPRGAMGKPINWA